MTTSSDSDGFVRLTADNMTAETIPGSVSGFNQVLMKGTVDITPVTAPKADLYCGLALRAVMHNDAAVDQYANLYTEDVQSTGSVVKIPAGSTAKISLKMVGSYIFSPGNNSVTTKSVAYYCTNNADVAKEKIKNCLIGNDPKLPLIAGECQVL